MATIGQYLSLITNAVYGEEVRSAIANAIQQCYTDATDVVKVSETEPTSENTRIWIKPTTDECKVPTLEEHEALDGEVSDLKSAFVNDIGQITGNEPMVFQKGYYRVYSDSTVADLSIPVTNNTTGQNSVCAKIACVPGDKFTVKAYGGASTASAYGFFNSNFEGIARGGASTLYSNKVTAPNNAAWFVVNNNVADNPTDYYAYKGNALYGTSYKRIGALTAVDDLDSKVETGWHYWTSSNVPANAPTEFAGVGGILLVYARADSSLVQIAMPNTKKIGIQYRFKSTNGWYDWIEMARRSDISAITSRFAGKKMSIIGDSISAFDPPGYRQYYPYGDVTDVSQMWWYRIISSSGAVLDTTKASSGSYVTSYLADGETRENYPTFYERCTGLGNPDVIFVELGGNDAQRNVPLGDYDYDTAYTELSESTFRTAYIKGLSALKANYPNADIYCFIIAGDDMKSKQGYAVSIRSIAEHFGIKCVDLSCLDYTKVQGPHADDHGMRQIASAIMNYSNDMQSTFSNGIKKSIESLMGVDVIEFTENRYYETLAESSTLNIIGNPKTTQNFKCAVVECSAGDEFTIVGESSTGNTRLYAFYDSTNVSLGRSDANLSGKFIAVAPANAAYVVINLRQNGVGTAYVRRNDVAEAKKNYGLGNGAITEAKKFFIYKDGYNDGQVQTIRVVSKYSSTGESFPEIRFRLMNKNETVLYTSPYYKLGSTVEMKQQEWRLPAYYKNYDRYEVRINVPSGVTVTVESVSTHIDTPHPYTGGVEFEAHHGFTGIYPPDTAIALEAAGKLGFGYCTITPKFTSDEVPVCCHDDDTIKDRLRYNDGTSITSGSADDKPMWEFTYADVLSRFDAGIKTSSIFAGTKVPTVDEFFEICSKMGMNACLSIHSDTGFNGYSGSAGCQTTVEEADARMQTIYNLAKKWGLLGKIYIKAGSATVQARAKNIFGNKAKYILIRGINSTWDPLDRAKECGFVPSSATSMSESEYTVYLEWFATGVTDAYIETAKSEGFETLQIAEVERLSGEEMKTFILKGITRFTLDYHCSAGLNW